MARRNKILVPEAREGLDRLKERVTNTQRADQTKYEVAREQGVELEKGYNGNIKAKDAGKVGGQIGGSMVKEMIRMAQQQLNEKR
ncbi:alpha/beta-type small acid-soluble spore protein [Radiobacillus kanasensis]|uniref:alpha/beta-type small acid-soluble spore protein n=1 Tax=Radiobacillus kanasensis TaxID=2844358 RepID=UPI001E2CC88B|nr:alpha/beta-type small acid-soluble spore protein [Radiobacillus kanasensis]UFT98284.1 alpha/beta-type small acid-soluble spore protein [Radiobacillus kanasensis]